jgi:hypothetical protein
MSNSRFWITDIDTSHYLFQWMPDWYGVVDEQSGGIVAYFNNKASADLLIQTLCPAPAASTTKVEAVNIIFDGPPGPEGPRFIEVETDDGRSIRAGEWQERQDGYWALRITNLPSPSVPAKAG